MPLNIIKAVLTTSYDFVTITLTKRDAGDKLSPLFDESLTIRYPEGKCSRVKTFRILFQIRLWIQLFKKSVRTINVGALCLLFNGHAMKCLSGKFYRENGSSFNQALSIALPAAHESNRQLASEEIKAVLRKLR